MQSMDGQLSFYEQDHSSFTRQLERCLVPGPICYVAKTDSIVIATCEMTVESYKYVVTAVATRLDSVGDVVVTVVHEAMHVCGQRLSVERALVCRAGVVHRLPSLCVALWSSGTRRWRRRPSPIPVRGKTTPWKDLPVVRARVAPVVR